MTATMRLSNYLRDNNRALKLLLVALGIFYFFGSLLAKHGDYWAIINMSTAFAVDPLHFMAAVHVDYPPTFYALQGVWLWLGSHLFHYNLAISYNYVNSTLYSYHTTRFGIFPFWGMVPILAALFLFVGIAYRELRNKWLALICFGPITFVSVIIMGQVDMVCVLFIFVSMILMQRALKAEKYFSLLVLGYLALGVSMQFKTYGGLLLPVYVIYTLALVRYDKLVATKSLFVLGSCLAAFLAAMFIVWLPYPGWFSTVLLHGESNWLLQRPSPLFQVPIWLLGYVFILCYTAVRVLRKPLTSLRDDRYFVFDNFAIVAWFFIAVITHPQWWMFLLPPALLVLDSFRSKNGLVFCILIFIMYMFYPMNWPVIVGVFATYRIPALILTRSLWGWVFTALAGLLLFWVFALNKELRAQNRD